MSSCDGLRVLLVGPYPPPFGGIASHLTMLIPGLIRRGAADICVLTLTSGSESVESDDGVVIYRVNLKKHVWRLLLPTNWPVVFACLRELADARFSIYRFLSVATQTLVVNEIAEQKRSDVVSFYLSNASLCLLPCSRLWNKTRGIVLTVFGECYDEPDFFDPRTSFIKRLIEKPSAVVSSSKHCAKSFKTYGIAREIEAVYYGIDLGRFESKELRQNYRDQLGVKSGEVLVTYMARFTEEMGLGRLLEIGTNLLNTNSRIRLLLAGAKGPLAINAKKFADQFPGRVLILHDIPFSLQPSIYAATDILVAPSADQHACMGMSIKEAMAASIPVIGSDAGGIPEAIIDGVTGILVPLDASRHVDISSMLHSIELLVNDQALRLSMGRAARQRAEQMFSTELTVDRMSDLFVGAKQQIGSRHG